SLNSAATKLTVLTVGLFVARKLIVLACVLRRSAASDELATAVAQLETAMVPGLDAATLTATRDEAWVTRGSRAPVLRSRLAPRVVVRVVRARIHGRIVPDLVATATGNAVQRSAPARNDDRKGDPGSSHHQEDSRRRSAWRAKVCARDRGGATLIVVLP